MAFGLLHHKHLIIGIVYLVIALVYVVDLVVFISDSDQKKHTPLKLGILIWSYVIIGLLYISEQFIEDY